MDTQFPLFERIEEAVLACVVNISEGQDRTRLHALAQVCGDSLLDVHSDGHHHRSVFTLAGREVEEAARSLATEAIRQLDIHSHDGVHPRIGVVDVVPFVPLQGSTFEEAIDARDRFAYWISSELGVPSFLYGPERTLPDIRKQAFKELTPDHGPPTPHVTAGACAVGARGILIAYNVWLESSDLAAAKQIAKEIRRPGIRALGLDVGGNAQVSCNLVEPEHVKPDAVYDLVRARARIARAELVGLVPRSVLLAIPATRWAELDLSAERTIEARLATAGLERGKI